MDFKFYCGMRIYKYLQMSLCPVLAAVVLCGTQGCRQINETRNLPNSHHGEENHYVIQRLEYRVAMGETVYVLKLMLDDMSAAFDAASLDGDVSFLYEAEGTKYTLTLSDAVFSNISKIIDPDGTFGSGRDFYPLAPLIFVSASAARPEMVVKHLPLDLRNDYREFEQGLPPYVDAVVSNSCIIVYIYYKGDYWSVSIFPPDSSKVHSPTK